MDEREILVEMIASAAAQSIVESQLFKMLILMDSANVNKDILSTNEEILNMPEEHLEQAASDGVRTVMYAFSDVVQKLSEKFTKEEIDVALEQNMENMVNKFKDQL